jgi:hypothetical protein
LIRRVAGAVLDAMVVVSGPIASAHLFKQAALFRRKRDQDPHRVRWHGLISYIHLGFAISDFADAHSAFQRPFGDGTT